MKQTKERWCEAEIYRIAGEVAIRLPDFDVSTAQAFFGHAIDGPGDEVLVVASSYLNLPMAPSGYLPRLSWRNLVNCARRRASQACGRTNEGAKRPAALAPIYHWYLEGFETNELLDSLW